MLYANLCYHDGDFVGSWSKDQGAGEVKKVARVSEQVLKSN